MILVSCSAGGIYNWFRATMSETQPHQYALVAYVRNSLGQFVENLRAELHPAHAHLPAHLSVLPPRPLVGGEEAAFDALRQACANVEPFDVEMGEVEAFIPTTPTVFIRVARAAYRLRELHDVLNTDGLTYTEPLVYMPHLTIAKLDDNQRAREVFEIARNRWAQFDGSRCVTIDQLTFVRGRDHRWTDIADIDLARKNR